MLSIHQAGHLQHMTNLWGDVIGGQKIGFRLGWLDELMDASTAERMLGLQRSRYEFKRVIIPVVGDPVFASAGDLSAVEGSAKDRLALALGFDVQHFPGAIGQERRCRPVANQNAVEGFYHGDYIYVGKVWQRFGPSGGPSRQKIVEALMDPTSAADISLHKAGHQLDVDVSDNFAPFPAVEGFHANRSQKSLFEREQLWERAIDERI